MCYLQVDDREQHRRWECGASLAIVRVHINRLRWGTKVMNCRNWPAILLVILASVAASSTSTPMRASNSNASFEQRELVFSAALHRASQFAGVAHVSSRPSCGEAQPPEEIETPNPLLTSSARGQKVKVSFIIGTDGKVHSPLILESAGMSGDSRVLQTVRTWRYRPATCNGVPTETEGKIEFSSR